MPFVERLYNLVLRLYPSDFRRRFGSEMAQVFRTALADEQQGTAVQRCAQAIEFVADTLSAALRERLFTSVRHTGLAWRELGRQRAFTITSVLALALGIGGLATAASVAWQAYFNPYAYRDVFDLVKISRIEGGRAPETRIPPDEYLLWTQQAESFSSLGGFEGGGVRAILNYNTRNAQVRQYRVTPSIMPTLGRAPSMGTLFRDDADPLPQVLLSYDLWEGSLDAPRDIVGERLALNGEPHRVVGVMPEGFWGGADLWTPLSITESTPAAELPPSLVVWARLRNGVTAEQAGKELTRIAAASQQHGPPLTYEPFHPAEARAARSAPLVALLALCSGIVFFMALANIRRGHAVSMARRAANSVPARQSLLVAVFGAVAGTAVLLLLTKLVIFLDARELEPSLALVGFDRGSAGALIILLAASALLLAWRARPRTAESTAGHGHVLPLLMRTVLAGVCLVTVGVALRGYEGIAKRIPDNPDPAYWITVTLFGPAYASDDERRNYYHRAVNSLGHLPGNPDVQVSTSRTLGIEKRGSFRFRREYTLPPEPDRRAVYSLVSPGPFNLGTPSLLAGRFFQETEKQPVAIIDEKLARHSFPGGQAVGQHITIASGPDSPRHEVTNRTIVGVVRLNLPFPTPDSSRPPWLFVPYVQDPIDSFQLAVRPSQNDDIPASAIRDALLSLTPDQALSEVYSTADTPFPIRRVRFLLFLLLLWGLATLLLLAQDVYSRSRLAPSGGLRKNIVLASLGGALLAVSAAYVARLVLQQQMEGRQPWEVLGLLADFAFTASLDAYVSASVITILTLTASLSGLLGARATLRR